MVRAVFRFWLALGALVVGGVVACATAGSGAPPPRSPATCERGLCATIVERSLSNRIVVDVAGAPEGAALHNAWVAEPGVAPCRGGRALHSVAGDAGVRMHGPLALPVENARFTMSFTSALSDGTSLDLDVRSPSGVTCLRVPLQPEAADGGAPPEGDGGRG
jgi:hypothetical protein